MTRSLLVFALVGAAGLAAGCGDDAAADDDDGDDVVVVNSGPDDATPSYDAGACADGLTQCEGGLCADLESDPFNCGACGATCASPGQICSGAVPCACPEPFIPSVLEPPFGDQVRDDVFEGILVGLAPLIADRIDLVLIGYALDTPVDTDLDLAAVLAEDPLAPPLVAAAYDVDVQGQNAKATYRATAGILRLATRCDVGLTGTLTGAVFAEVANFNPVPIEGGCQIEVEEVAFEIGDPCPEAGNIAGGPPR